VRALLSHPSCDLLARDEDGNTALHITASRGHHDVVLELASRYTTTSSERIAGMNNEGDTAASRGHHEVVLELASRYTTASSESIAGMNNEGDTPLHLACRNGSMKCVKILANVFPINLTINNSGGDTPLAVALLAEHNEVVLLLNQKYDVCIESDQSSGMLAGNIKAVEKASKCNPMLAACLLAAAKQGSLVLVRALLSHPSCDLLARDEDGNTALHIAASRGHHEVVLELASRCMKELSEVSTCINDKGQTALHLACCKGWVKCVRTLATRFPCDLRNSQ
jgi:ankyrin repeat protein